MQMKNMFVSKILADMLSRASLFSLLRLGSEWRHVNVCECCQLIRASPRRIGIRMNVHAKLLSG